ncbi:Hsp70 family protein [Desulfonatronum thioautotrophicum]|uniref:Hsp70 family protein n=1 Tax=Desulfonatronum thioautotrophicum TaxID=617001 RepID=UPI0005EBCBE2|nr:Hsp70 family protein [Desulfonatronum thioautotrophicum]
MKSIFGIDLGTTNSCISLLRDGKPEVIQVDGSPIVPSVVSFDGDSIIVGQRARNRALLYPEQTVASIKRHMGETVSMDIAGRSLSPEQISASILSYLKEQVENQLDETVTDVVITVPAYFSDAQRRATRMAGELAGLNVERIINEPSAAALFYNHLQLDEPAGNGEQLALVYDLGGGTFDVSVLRIGEITEVLASTGNTRLGGDDFDQKILEFCIDHINTKHHLDPRPHRPAMARLLAAAEQAKIGLSSAPFVQIEEALLPVGADKTIDISLELSRERFVDMIQDYLEATRDEVRKALSEASLKTRDIHQVLLVGGCTRIPAVIQLMDEMFGTSRKPPVDPDLCVAKGAAIQGGIITGQSCEHVFIDVTAHSLGTAALTGEFERRLEVVPIIPRNTQVPVRRSELFYTVAPEQDAVKVEVYQGESPEPEECELIGKIGLRLVPAPVKCPILIEYAYDLDGIIHVRVEQKGYSKMKEANLDSQRRGQQFGDLLDDETIDLDLGDSDEDGELADTEASPQLLNYILQKARNALDEMQKSGNSAADELRMLIETYEQALGDGDDDAVEEAEERLLDYLDELKAD